MCPSVTPNKHLKCKYGKIIGYIQIWIYLIAYIFDFFTCIFFILIQADDVPRSDWNVAQLKDYCLKHGLTVVRQDGKNKAPVRKDYYDIARVHAEKNGLRYKADAIMKSYGIKCVRCGICSSFFLSLSFSHFQVVMKKLSNNTFFCPKRGIG